jgi:hypothetical protein
VLPSSCRAAGLGPRLAVELSEHPDQHRSERPILFAVDQKFGEGAALRVAPERADRVGPVKSGSMRTWSNSARGAGPRASRRSRSRRLSSSGLMAAGYAVEPSVRVSACLRRHERTLAHANLSFRCVRP